VVAGTPVVVVEMHIHMAVEEADTAVAAGNSSDGRSALSAVVVGKPADWVEAEIVAVVGVAAAVVTYLLMWNRMLVVQL